MRICCLRFVRVGEVCREWDCGGRKKKESEEVEKGSSGEGKRGRWTMKRSIMSLNLVECNPMRVIPNPIRFHSSLSRNRVISMHGLKTCLRVSIVACRRFLDHLRGMLIVLNWSCLVTSDCLNVVVILIVVEIE